MATRLFIAITYGNFQRAGAAINLTINEASKACTIQPSDAAHSQRLRMFVADHKTASSIGPANIYLDSHDIELFQHYLRKDSEQPSSLTLCSSDIPT